MTEHIQVVPDKCRACRRCEVACIAAHHGMNFKEAMKHRDELVSRVQVVKTEGFKTTVRCHQCEHAPCAAVCPTGALQQDEDGRIIMRVQYCVACKMCIAACPYGTISLDTIGMPAVDGEEGETLAQRARREVAVRCDMCRAWRMENGKRITACMEACPAHALSLVLADGSVIEAPMPEKKPATDDAAAKPATPVAEAGPRLSVTSAALKAEEAKTEEAAQATTPAEVKSEAHAAPAKPEEAAVTAAPSTEAPKEVPASAVAATTAAETEATAPQQEAPVQESPAPLEAAAKEKTETAPAPQPAKKVASPSKGGKKPGKKGKK